MMGQDEVCRVGAERVSAIDALAPFGASTVAKRPVVGFCGTLPTPVHAARIDIQRHQPGAFSAKYPVLRGWFERPGRFWIALTK